MKFTRSRAILSALILGFSALAQAVPIAFQFNYLDGAGEGFNDLSFGMQRRAALEYAGSQWGSLLPASYAGETIHVGVYMNALGTTGTLASGGGVGLSWNYSAFPVRNTVYSSALANHLAGRDLSSNDEIRITFNESYSYYLGTDGRTTTGTYDFVSLAMHEITHGLGFSSRIDKDPSDGSIGPILSVTSSSSGIRYQYASIYDRFLVDASGSALLAMTDAQRAAAITSGGLYWNGANGIAGNAGLRPELYAPATAASGSSIAHLDKDTSVDLLMEPNLVKSRPVAADPVTLGMLADMGWTISPVPEPGQLFMLLAGLGCLGIVLRRQRQAQA